MYIHIHIHIPIYFIIIMLLIMNNIIILLLELLPHPDVDRHPPAATLPGDVNTWLE